MTTRMLLLLVGISLSLGACNKASPPPQEPAKPRSAVQIEAPLQLPTP